MRRTTLKEVSSRIGSLTANRGPRYEFRNSAGNRTDSIAKLKSAYIYLVGGINGWYAFERKIKESQKEAKIQRGDCTEWHLNTQQTWELLVSCEKLFEVINAQGIKSYKELIIRANRK